MTGPGKDSTIAARVPHEFREELEAKVDEFRKAGIGYPDGRQADLSYVIRIGLRAYLDSRAAMRPGLEGGLFATVRDGGGWTGPGVPVAPATSDEALPGLGDLDVPSHTDGPETEKLAAAAAWPASGNSRRRIVNALYSRGGDAVNGEGYTADELIVELRMYSAQRRLHDLKRGGWVEVAHDAEAEGPVRRKTRRGAWADVYVLTPAALERRRAEGKR